MCLHDLIVKEFERTKSLSSLIYLIEHGREIEFSFEGRNFFLSCRHSQKNVSLWFNKKEQIFDSIEQLIEKATIINGSTLLDVLPQIQLETIF